MKIFPKQRDLGIAGMALLRNWIVGRKYQANTVIEDIKKICNSTEGELTAGNDENEISEKSVSSGYQSWAETYDSTTNPLIQIEEPIVKRLIKELPIGETLDAGCGTGRYSLFLKSIGHKVVGIDQSEAMLSKAKEKNQEINYIRGKLTSLPFDNNSFNLVICSLASTHFLSLKKIFSEFSRVIRSGGYLLISDIHPWFIALGGQADFHDKDGKWRYIKNYIHWCSDYFREFKRLGLTVTEFEEPVIGPEHIEVLRKGLDIRKETIVGALEGLPLAVVWVLKK